MSGRKPWLSKKLEGLGPQFYSDLESALNFGFNGIWHDLFFRDGFFSQIWDPKTIGLEQILGFGDFPWKLVFWCLIWSNSTKKSVTERKIKKAFFGQIDYTLILEFALLS